MYTTRKPFVEIAVPSDVQRFDAFDDDPPVVEVQPCFEDIQVVFECRLHRQPKTGTAFVHVPLVEFEGMEEGEQPGMFVVRIEGFRIEVQRFELVAADAAYPPCPKQIDGNDLHVDAVSAGKQNFYRAHQYRRLPHRALQAQAYPVPFGILPVQENQPGVLSLDPPEDARAVAHVEGECPAGLVVFVARFLRPATEPPDGERLPVERPYFAAERAAYHMPDSRCQRYVVLHNITCRD